MNATTNITDHYGLHVGDEVYRIGQDRWGRSVNSIKRFTVARFTATQMILTGKSEELRVRLDGSDLRSARVIGSGDYFSGLMLPNDERLTRARHELNVARVRAHAHEAVDLWMKDRNSRELAAAAARALDALAATETAR